MSGGIAYFLLVYFCLNIGILLYIMMYSVLLCEGLVLDRLS